MTLPKISTNFWKSKAGKLSILITLGAVCLIGGTIWAVSAARAHQRASFRAHIALFHQSLEQQGQKIESEKTIAVTQAALQEAQQNLREWTAQSSATVLGVDVTSSTTEQAEAEVRSQAEKLIRIIDDAKLLIEYQHVATLSVGKLTSGSSQNLEQLKQLEQLWRTVSADLAAVQPPERAKDFHAQLVKQVEACAHDLAALVVLYDKQDVAGFTAKKNEFDNKIGSLQAQGDLFGKLAKEQDVELVSQLHELEHRLEKLEQ